ncbi:hypothetical protein HPG69_001625 [Diceros bicornis minor]|uniref:HTH psq-type domain-containing protein n=1 Tax=Diceros bicornis minor TaxID=77932 RepID=A0A7J7FFZ2_DICBM|nr:hypothetical protein HPG69_001625 [Diceros bicornis minor]
MKFTFDRIEEFNDLPQNCDPNIPLVAQELMKKMIRQFAIEYISKSGKIQENRNGSIGPSLICKSIQMNQAENSVQEEQEGPLDLTVNRMQEQNTQQDLYKYSEPQKLRGIQKKFAAYGLFIIIVTTMKNLPDLYKTRSNVGRDEQQHVIGLENTEQILKFSSEDISMSTKYHKQKAMHFKFRSSINVTIIEQVSDESINKALLRYCSFQTLAQEVNLMRKSANPDNPRGDGVLDLSTKKTSIKSEESSVCDPSSENSVAGRLHRNREDYVERSAEFADGLLSKALKDIQSGALDINKAGILYGIPQKTLLLHLEALPAGKPASFKNKTRDFNDSYSYKDSKETCAVLQKVALWARAQAERTEKSKLNLLETSELKFPAASSYLHQLTLQKMVTQFKEKSESLQYETSHPTVQLKIPQLRVSSVSKPQPDGPGLLDVMYQVSKTSSVLEGSALQKLKNILPKQNKIECSGPVTHSSVDSYFLHGDLSPLCLNSKNGTVDGTSENTEDGLDRKDNKQPRKKRGRYRQYDHEIMEEAIAMVMSGKMSVSKAQGIYGVPHSTLEYKVKERSGTLKTPPKKKLRLPDTGLYNMTDSGTGSCKNSSKPVSTVDAKSEEATKMEKGKSALSKVLESLCIHHQQQVLAMLKFLIQEQNAASLCCCNTSYTMSSESQKPLIEDDLHGLFCSCEYRLAERGCLQNERQSPGFVPLPVCIKDLHCLSCQTVAIEHFKTVVNGGIANSYHSHRCCSGLLPNVHSTKSGFHTPLPSREVCDVSVGLKDVCRSRSPSPPPLSPVQTEGFEKLKDVISELSALENNRLEANINQPPSLTPAEISSDRGDHEAIIVLQIMKKVKLL